MLLIGFLNLFKKRFIFDDYRDNFLKKGPKMLPFLKDKKEGGMSAPVEAIERKHDEDSESYEMLDAVAEDILNAVESKDKRLLKDALEALCEYIQEEDEERDEELFGEE